MTALRVGTRGSDLALWQTRWVCDLLRRAYPALTVEEVIITTHGDTAADQRFDRDWPVGGFVGAIEQALAAGRVDFAVHSYKDLPTVETEGLVIAAVPQREAVHDVLVTRDPVAWDRLPAGFRLGTSSPRRAAQFRRLGNVEIVPIRGNVPTRVAKVRGAGLDGTVLAAAGVRRLGLELPHAVDLPTDRFVPAPAQGALAVQTCEGSRAADTVRTLNDPRSWRRVQAERSFLRAINAGCHTPVGALATADGDSITLHGQLFSNDGVRMVEATEMGDDPVQLGERLAERLMTQLGAKR